MSTNSNYNYKDDADDEAPIGSPDGSDNSDDDRMKTHVPTWSRPRQSSASKLFQSDDDDIKQSQDQEDRDDEDNDDENDNDEDDDGDEVRQQTQDRSQGDGVNGKDVRKESEGTKATVISTPIHLLPPPNIATSGISNTSTTIGDNKNNTTLSPSSSKGEKITKNEDKSAPEKQSVLRTIRRSISFGSTKGKTENSSPKPKRSSIFFGDKTPSLTPSASSTTTSGSAKSTSTVSSSSEVRGMPPLNTSPVLHSSSSDPLKPPLRSPLPPAPIKRSVSSIEASGTNNKAVRRQSLIEVVKNVEAVSCVLKVTIQKLVFPENKGLYKKLRPGTNVQVVFERGDRTSKTFDRPMQPNSDNGSMEVLFNESVRLTLTMYRNPTTNKYNEKQGKLIILQEKSKGKVKRVFSSSYKEVGFVDFDLAKIFDDYVSSDRVMGVSNCPIPGTSIYVTLQPKVTGEDSAHFQKPRVDQGEAYTGDYKMDIREGSGKMVYSDGSSYEGEWRNDVWHGKGKLIKKDVGVYIGDFFEGKEHGRGHFTSVDGSFYAGDYKQGKACGQGKFIADGDMYEGDWEDDMEHGRGKLTYSTGDVYEGDFSDDVKHGDGTLTKMSGDKYVGQFRDDMISGRGSYLWASGDRYSGEWVDNTMHGSGEYKWSNGDVYVGTWRNNKKHGDGKFVGCNGDVFEGTFDNDNKSSGKYIFGDGDIYEGSYDDDLENGAGVMIYGSGDRYEGMFVDDMKHGLGVYTFSNGSVYKGEYFQDQMHGSGVYQSYMGDSYDGEYQHNKRNGYGKYFYNDGSYYEGYWKDNLKHGEGFYRWPNGNSFTGQFIEDKKSNRGQYSVIYNVV